MNKNILYVLSILTGGLLASCDADQVDGVDFGVTVHNNIAEIYAGDEVTFDFTGNPSYVVFYSGEYGNRYVNKDRVKADEIESMDFSCSTTQSYTQSIFIGNETLSVFVSTDFKGVYTPVGIEAATWTKISGKGPGQLQIPAGDKYTETLPGQIDLAAYKDKAFYLGFKYEVPEIQNDTYAMPIVSVQSLSLKRQIAGEVLTLTNPLKEFSFRHLIIKGRPEDTAYGSIDDAKFGFQAKDVFGIAVKAWTISKKIDPLAVSPDLGTPIKSLDMVFPSYTYRYDTPGEYTVTFVARNANAWNTKSVVKEVKIIVKDKTENTL